MVHRSLVGSHGAAVRAPDRGPRWRVPGLVRPGAGGRAAGRRTRAGRGGAFGRPAWTAGLRAEVVVDGSLGARIREAAAPQVPYVAVIGAARGGGRRGRPCACATAGGAWRDRRSLDASAGHLQSGTCSTPAACSTPEAPGRPGTAAT